VNPSIDIDPVLLSYIRVPGSVTLWSQMCSAWHQLVEQALIVINPGANSRIMVLSMHDHAKTAYRPHPWTDIDDRILLELAALERTESFQRTRWLQHVHFRRLIFSNSTRVLR